MVMYKQVKLYDVLARVNPWTCKTIYESLLQTKKICDARGLLFELIVSPSHVRETTSGYEPTHSTYVLTIPDRVILSLSTEEHNSSNDGVYIVLKDRHAS